MVVNISRGIMNTRRCVLVGVRYDGNHHYNHPIIFSIIIFIIIIAIIAIVSIW